MNCGGGEFTCFASFSSSFAQEPILPHVRWARAELAFEALLVTRTHEALGEVAYAVFRPAVQVAAV